MPPSRLDVLLGLLIGLPAVASALAGPEGDLPLPLVVALACAFTAALVWRRRAPLIAPLVVALSVQVLGILDTQGPSMPTIPLALGLAAYTLGHDAPMPHAAIAGALSLVTLWAGQLANDLPGGDLVAVGVIVGVPWTFGRALRRRAEEAERREVDAARQERERIARELHDVVSHSISVVSVQTQAVRRRLRPDQQEEAAQLRAVEATVRDAMGEMRRLFGMLRADGAGAPLDPQPGLDQVDELLAETRAAGHRVDLRREGVPRDLPPGRDLAAYRVLQEALTNVRRHAPRARAEVALRYEEGALEVEVTDDGPGGTVNGHEGHGLLGMRERLELYGGELSAGPRPGGGFRVLARLPLAEGSP